MRLNTPQSLVIALDPAHHESAFERGHDQGRHCLGIHSATDRDTGQARGFGFVEMSDNSEGDRAIAALNGTNLDGRALNVNEARPKTDRGSGGGGYRGNSGGGTRQNNRW